MDAHHVNKTKKPGGRKVNWRFDLNRSRSFFTLTLVNFDWPYTHTHTQKINLEKCPCTWEKKNFWKKNLQKKGTNELAVFSHGAMHSQWMETEETENFFIYIIYTSIYIWIYLHHLAIGSVGDPFQSRRQPIFFFWPPFSSLNSLHLFPQLFFFCPASVFIFLCYNTVILFNFPLMTS